MANEDGSLRVVSMAKSTPPRIADELLFAATRF